MADAKISQLPAVVTPAGTDEFAVNQAGTTKKVTLNQISGAVNYWQRIGTDISPVNAGDTATIDGGLTIGTGAAGVDYTLTFDGENSDGVLTWDEDNSRWGIVDTFRYVNGSITNTFGNDGANVAGTFNQSTNGSVVRLGGTLYSAQFNFTGGAGGTVTILDGTYGINVNGTSLLQDDVTLNGSLNVNSGVVDSFINLVNGNSAGVSAANEGRIRYNSGTNAVEVSLSGGGWDALLTDSAENLWDRVGTDLRPHTSGDTVRADGGLTIGLGAAGVDYTITFDGEDNDGVITWLEDEDTFDFTCDLRITDATNPELIFNKTGGFATMKLQTGSTGGTHALQIEANGTNAFSVLSTAATANSLVVGAGVLWIGGTSPVNARNVIDIANDTTQWNIQNDTGGHFAIHGTANNLLFADYASDEVGIGTATPGGKLEVNDGTDFVQVLDGTYGIQVDTSSSGDDGVYVTNGGYSAVLANSTVGAFPAAGWFAEGVTTTHIGEGTAGVLTTDGTLIARLADNGNSRAGYFTDGTRTAQLGTASYGGYFTQFPYQARLGTTTEAINANDGTPGRSLKACNGTYALQTDDNGSRVVQLSNANHAISANGSIDHESGNVIYLSLADDIETEITAASAGDTLVLASGTYSLTSTIDISKKIHIRGQGKDSTIIEWTGAGASDLFRIDGNPGTADGSSFSDFGVRDATSSGNDLFHCVFTDALRFNNIHFYSNQSNGRCIFFNGNSSVVDCVIENTSANLTGNMKFLDDTFALTSIDRCTVVQNGSSDGTIITNSSSMNIYNSLFLSTGSPGTGGTVTNSGLMNCYNVGAYASGGSPSAYDFKCSANTLNLYTCNSMSGRVDESSTVNYLGDLTVADEAYGAGWNGSEQVPTKNAVYDKIESIAGDITSVGDVASGAAFDGTQGTTLTFFNAGGNKTLSYDGIDFDFNDEVTATDGGFTASLADSGNSRAGYFFDGTYTVELSKGTDGLNVTDGTRSILAVNPTYALQVSDTVRTVQFANGTYAWDATGNFRASGTGEVQAVLSCTEGTGQTSFAIAPGGTQYLVFNSFGGDGVHIGLLPTSARNHLIFTTTTYANQNHGHGTADADPHIFIHSGANPSVDNTQWMSFYHDQTDAFIDNGSGDIVILPDDAMTVEDSSANRYLLVDSTGGTFALGDKDGGIDNTYFEISSANDQAQVWLNASRALDLDSVGGNYYIGDIDGATSYIYMDATNFNVDLFTNSVRGLRVSATGTTIGVGTAAVDYTLTFDGNTNDGVITWDESAGVFLFDHAVDITGNLSVTGSSDLDGAVVINESGADVDFRVEGDTDVNLLTTDAGNDKVGIGTIAGGGKLTVDGNIGNLSTITFTSLDTTPDVSGSNFFKTANAGATSITNFDNGVTTQRITIVVNDANTTFVEGATLALKEGANYVASSGDVLTFYLDGTVWREMRREITEHLFVPITTNAQYGNYAVNNTGSNASAYFNTKVPDNFLSLVNCFVYGIIDPSTAGASKDIDIYVDYATVGEAYNTHTASDTTTVYDLTGTGNQIYRFTLNSLLGSLAGDDSLGVQMDHNAIGNSIYYLGIEIEYRASI
jgi:hypothetical protein